MTNSCFVIMPFTPSYRTFYERVIRVAVEDAGLSCVRADEIFSKAQVTNDIWTQIRKCRLVLAELTGKNPNVLYELGLAHAVGKPAIIITRNEEDVPFDLKALRYLFYDVNDPYWGEGLREQLTVMCRNMMDQNDFGSVLADISFEGDRTFINEVSSKEELKKKYDLTGMWYGHVKFPDLEIEVNSWNLNLVQLDNILKGTLIVTYPEDGDLTIVRQSIAGELDGDNISFHGISYSFTKKRPFSDYDLDTFQGSVKQNGKIISGNVLSGTAKGKLKLEPAKIN